MLELVKMTLWSLPFPEFMDFGTMLEENYTDSKKASDFIIMEKRFISFLREVKFEGSDSEPNYLRYEQMLK